MRENDAVKKGKKNTVEPICGRFVISRVIGRRSPQYQKSNSSMFEESL